MNPRIVGIKNQWVASGFGLPPDPAYKVMAYVEISLAQGDTMCLEVPLTSEVSKEQGDRLVEIIEKTRKEGTTMGALATSVSQQQFSDACARIASDINALTLKINEVQSAQTNDTKELVAIIGQLRDHMKSEFAKNDESWGQLNALMLNVSDRLKHTNEKLATLEEQIDVRIRKIWGELTEKAMAEGRQ